MFNYNTLILMKQLTMKNIIIENKKRDINAVAFVRTTFQCGLWITVFSKVQNLNCISPFSGFFCCIYKFALGHEFNSH